MADGTDVSNVVESKQYIDVMINNEQYGIDINFIDNIVRMQRITRVPKAQDYFPGVINLRGEIIPVMSLRRRPQQSGPYCLGRGDRLMVPPVL